MHGGPCRIFYLLMPAWQQFWVHRVPPALYPARHHLFLSTLPCFCGGEFLHSVMPYIALPQVMYADSIRSAFNFMYKNSMRVVCFSAAGRKR